jgi:hypothetical protein
VCRFSALLAFCRSFFRGSSAVITLNFSVPN